MSLRQKLFRGFAGVACLSLIGALLVLRSAAQTLSSPEKTALIERMNGVYYSIANQNFKGMQCAVESDWGGYFSRMPELKNQPEKLASIQKAAAKLATQLTVGPNGHAKAVTTGADTTTEGEQLETVTTGFNQSIQGFFLGWAGFTLNKPLPYKAEDVELRSTDQGYKMSKTSDAGSVQMQFSKDLALEHIAIDSPRINIDEDLGFVSLSGGLALSKMRVELEMKPSNKLPVTEIDVAYQQLSGLELPHALTIHVETAGMEPIVLTLDNCKLSQ